MKNKAEKLNQVRQEIKDLQNARKANLICGNEYITMLHNLYKKEKELSI